MTLYKPNKLSILFWFIIASGLWLQPAWGDNNPSVKHEINTIDVVRDFNLQPERAKNIVGKD